jgi:anti-sigma factor (TIGR02949 family)
MNVMTTNELTSCDDALRVLAAHLDGELGIPLHEQVERHLATCRSCYSRAEFEARLKSKLAELDHEPVRPALTERVHTLVQTFSVAEGE